MPVKIHNKEYLTVAERIATFRSKYPEWTINTDLISNVGDMIVIKSTIHNESGHQVGSGYAEEVRGSTTINKTSALENCETSAIGRALASCGYGGEQYASANEVTDAIINQAAMKATERLIKHNEAVRDNLESIIAVKQALAEGNFDYAAECMRELSDDVRSALGVAATKGGIFGLEDDKLFRSTEYKEATARYFEELNNG